MLKKIGITLGIICLLVAIGFGVLVYRLVNMAHRIEGTLDKTAIVSLAKVADGTYAGSYGDFLNTVSLEVTVKKHKIVKITIIDQHSGSGYEALATVDRIIKAQSPKVDAVTGASSSSRVIMIAVNKALEKGGRK
ncbi:MAG: FMN-binding protein [Candidatus Margulisiibacteriota bacterium]|jgi:uncharacterized protein with FMN-binding domain